MHLKSATASSLLTAALLLALTPAPQAAPLFEDNFDTDSSANWKILAGYYADSNPADYTAEFAVDYSKLTYKRYQADRETFEVLPIPPAPNSPGTSRGLKLTVNHNDELAERFAINLFPNGQSFSGDFAVKFDLWLNYNGPAEGGVGSTEHFLAGINHSGEIMNWHSFVVGFTNAAALPGVTTPGVGAANSDGVWITYPGEGGATIDGRVAFGTPNGPPSHYASTANPPINANPDVPSGFLDRDGDNSPDNSDQDIYVGRTLFPQPRFETAGAPGKRWVEMEISQVGDVITWKVDGKHFARVTNSTAFKSGNLMLGYMDIFTSIADPRDENFALFDNLRVEPIRTVIVDTADNGSGAGDGRTSLAEALSGLQENDRITFNIPGAGPHILATPIGGYPLVARTGVSIDGYTQPGSNPNTNSILGGNNARIQIVLDSTSDAQSGDPAKPDRASTRLPYPGYGDSENAILGILDADHVSVRGLSFLARHTPGSDEDPSIYAVALVREARGARVQGSWFGLAPDGNTVEGFAAGVAGFRHRVTIDGTDVDTFSGGLIVGTDSDGIDDLAEHNILCGLHIALALELPEALTAGNYFNVKPDGNSFLNVEDVVQAQIDAGREAGDSSVENYENGRLTTDSVIGVRGDGINDANERNIFNFAVYDQLIEFYSNATNVVLAGNHFGVGVDGSTTAPVPTLQTPNLIGGSDAASFRIGSNHDGIADDLEGNLIQKVPGTGFFVAGVNVPVVARRNTLVGNGFAGFPFADGANNRPYDTYYAPYVTDIALIVPTLTSYTGGKLSGTVAIPADGYFADIDVYVTDAAAPAGEVIPGTYLGTFFEGGTEDTDLTAGRFTFDLSALPVPGGRHLCVAVTYSSVETASDVGSSVTGPVSNAVETGGSVSQPIGPVAIAREGTGSVRLTWQNGTAPFQVQRRSPLTGGAWENVGTATNEKSVSVPIAADQAYFRVQGQ